MAKRVCVDLDHVLAEPNGIHIGEPYPGAQFFLKMLKASGLEVFIHTARLDPTDESGQQTDAVLRWLKKHDMPYDMLCGKPAAIAYIDDRAIKVGPHPTETDYEETYQKLVDMFSRQMMG